MRDTETPCWQRDVKRSSLSQVIRRSSMLHVVQAVFVAGIAFVLTAVSLPGVSARPGDPGSGLALGQARKDAVIVRYRDKATAAGKGKARRSVGATKVQRISPFDDDQSALFIGRKTGSCFDHVFDHFFHSFNVHACAT